MKSKILLITLFTLLLGCSKNDTVTDPNDCYYDDPWNLFWLTKLKESMTDCPCEMSLIEGTYKEQVVFFISMTDPLCDDVFSRTLLDCKGDTIKTFTYDEDLVFYNEVTIDSVLYRCKNTQ